MGRAAIGLGSIGDTLNAITAQLQGCADRHAIEYRYGVIVRSLEGLAGRALRVRQRGGSLHGVDAQLAWLKATVREHPGLQDAEAEPLRAELLRLIERVRGR